MTYWLLIAFSWIGSASLQYIRSGEPGAEPQPLPEAFVPHYPLDPYLNYYDPPLPNDLSPYQVELTPENFPSATNDVPPESRRRRRTVNESEIINRWLPNLLHNDRALNYQGIDEIAPYAKTDLIISKTNDTENEIQEPMDKKTFSPWGGKRAEHDMENMWTWKRASNIREPSMPKRVRFSPWGGKRSGQMIYKPGSKASKVLYASSVPELTRVVSNYFPFNKRVEITGFEFVPSVDKRHPIKILALSTRLDERNIRDAMPYNTFMETVPRLFKHGHTYSDVVLKKDGKRKVKFSAWGGKRSPPIIGPIWTPTSDSAKDSTLKAVIMLRNSKEIDNLQ